jgi:hypothetical protein
MLAVLLAMCNMKSQEVPGTARKFKRILPVWVGFKLGVKWKMGLRQTSNFLKKMGYLVATNLTISIFWRIYG